MFYYLEEDICSKDSKNIDEGRSNLPTLKLYGMLSVCYTKDFVYPYYRFKVWSRASALHQTNYAANIGPRILRYLETYFNIPFPLPKQDMVALPDFGFSAMENWGLITFR
jgi:hypothetical protein